MTTAKQHSREFLDANQKTVAQTRQHGTPIQLSIALSNLGLALFQAQKFEEGIAQFDEALALAQNIGDAHLQKQVLGIKVTAFQGIKRFPDAYETACQILELAEQVNDSAMKCDALISQGQTLLESGEPMIASERLQAAREIALALNDKRRQMHVGGVMGHISLAIAATNQAETYFDHAFSLAQDINDQRAAYGFLGNEAMLLSWTGDHQQAVGAFEQVYAYYNQVEDFQGQLQTLHYLVKGYRQLNDEEKTLHFAERAIALGQNEEPEYLIPFYQAVIPIYHLQGRNQLARQAITQATALIRKVKDRHQRLDFLLKQIDLQQKIDLSEPVVETSATALDLAEQLNRQNDTVHLIGVMGSTLAAQGDFQQTIDIFSMHLTRLNVADDVPTERALLHQLIRACDALDQIELLLDFTARGQTLAQDAEDEPISQRYGQILLEALLRNERYETAIPLLNAALKQPYAQDDEELRQLDLLLKLGDSYFALEQFEMAIATFERALPLSKQVGQPLIEAQILGRLGTIYAEQGELARSITYTRGAIELTHQLEDEQTVGELLCLLALDYRDLGQTRQSVECCRKAISAFEKIEAQSFIDDARALLDELQAIPE